MEEYEMREYAINVVKERRKAISQFKVEEIDKEAEE